MKHRNKKKKVGHIYIYIYIQLVMLFSLSSFHMNRKLERAAPNKEQEVSRLILKKEARGWQSTISFTHTAAAAAASFIKLQLLHETNINRKALIETSGKTLSRVSLSFP